MSGKGLKDSRINSCEPRVLMITQLPPPTGGIATWSQRFTEYSRANNLPVAVVNNSVVGRRKKNLRRRKSPLAETVRTATTLWRTVTGVRRFGPNIVHVNTTCSPYGLLRDWLCMVTVPTEIPIVLHCRANIADQLRGSKLGRAVLQKAARRAKVVLVLNQWSHDYLLTQFGLHSVLLPNFVPADLIADSRPVERKVLKTVVFSGHVEASKGVEEIFDVARRRPNINFLLAGAMSNELYTRNRPDNVTLLGDLSRNAVVEMLDRADAFLFPSHTEGFSNALLEAMARGLPAIATDVGANRMMLEDGGGILVPPKSPDDIVHALNDLENQFTRMQMSLWNRRKVASSYTIERVVAQLYEVYRCAASDPPADEER